MIYAINSYDALAIPNTEVKIENGSQQVRRDFDEIPEENSVDQLRRPGGGGGGSIPDNAHQLTLNTFLILLAILISIFK